MIPTCSEKRAVARGMGAALFGLLVLAMTPIAHAETAAEIETAKAAIVEGRARLEKGDLAGARDQFKAAWALVRTPRNGVELAETHEKLRELVEARMVYVEVTKLPPRDKESAESLAAREKADARAADLAPRIPTITVRLENVPKGAEPSVSIDDGNVPVDALSAPRRLNPGKHVVVVRVAGQPTKKTTFEIAEQQARVVVVDLALDEPTAKTEPGPQSMPSAKSDAPTATPSKSKEALRTGGTSTITWIGLGVGGLGLLVGGVTGAMAAAKATVVKDNCPNQLCPPPYHDDLNSAKSLSTLSNVGFAVGAVGVGVGVWGLVAGTRNEPVKAGAARVQPFLGFGSVGVSGAF